MLNYIHIEIIYIYSDRIRYIIERNLGNGGIWRAIKRGQG